MKSFFFLLIAVLIAQLLGFQHQALAADAEQGHALMTPEEQEIHLRAKKRMYPGGRDEDSLKVQSQLQQANRKMAPATDVPPEDSAPDATAD